MTLLAALASRPEHQVFLTDGERTWTWTDLAVEVARFVGVLHPLPVGTRFAVLCSNRAEVVAAYVAARWTGTVIVPLNTSLVASELAWQLDDCDARVVFAGEPQTGVLASARAAREERTRFVVLGAAPGWESLGAPTVAPPVEEDPERVWVQMYTSGTTGRPRGALLTQANLLSLVDAWLHEMPLDPTCRVLQVTPLFHVGALLMVLCSVLSGSTLVLPAAFQPGHALRLLHEERVTHTLLVPTMIRWMLHEPEVDAHAFPHLRVIVYGAAPMPTPWLLAARRVFSAAWLQGYGLTETGGLLTILRADDHEVDPEGPLAGRLRSAGRALTCCEVRIVDAHDDPVPIGETGEVVARGSNVGPGYHGLPEATTEAWRGGWFHTGDAGWMDAEGYLFLVDRIKDMILVGGENVFSREVEAVLEAHDDVAEATVIGVPHEVFGEEVVALVVLRPHARTEGADRQLIRHCRAHLARYKCPTQVHLRPSLPRNAAGKVKKSELRAPHWAGRERAI